MHKQRRWRKKSCDCGFLAAIFLLALGILGGKLWSTWDLKTWKHCRNYLLALYKNVTCYSSSLRLFVYISTLAIWAILKEVFALIRFEKYLKPPLLFLLFLPLTCAWKRKKRKKKKGMSHPSSRGSSSACSKNTQYSGRKPSLSLGLLQFIPWL